MKSVFQIFAVAAFVLLFSLPALSSDFPTNGFTVDNELMVKLAEFESFARLKIKQLDFNHKNSSSHMEITRLDDGTYRARYHKIDDATMQVKVRRSQSASAPYVGIISYREQVYESSAHTPEDFQPALFAVVEVIPNRHIFSYRKGVWN